MWGLYVICEGSAAVPLSKYHFVCKSYNTASAFLFVNN